MATALQKCAKNEPIDLDNPLSLPVECRSPVLILSIGQTTVGLSSFLLGIIGFLLPGHQLNGGIVIGVNIWAGLIYMVTGATGISLHTKHQNYMTHLFFAMSIISLVLTFAHFFIFLGFSILNEAASSTNWLSITSGIMAGLQLVLSLISMALLGNFIYCRPSYTTVGFVDIAKVSTENKASQHLPYAFHPYSQPDFYNVKKSPIADNMPHTSIP